MLELLPCLLPDCPASGRDVEHLSLRHEIGFTRAVVGPDGIVMAVGK